MALFSFNSDQNKDRNRSKRNKKSIPEVPSTEEEDNRETDDSILTEITDSIEIDESEPDYQADYEAYLEFFNNGYHPFPGEPLTFEQFKEINYYTPEYMARHLKFGPGIPASVINAGRTAAVSYATDRASRLIAAVATGNSNAVQSELQDILDTGGNVINVIKGNSNNNDGNSGPPGVEPNRGNTKYASHSQLNLDPKPVEVSFNSGISPNVYAPYDLDAAAYYSPLHISHAKVKFSKLLSGSKMSNYFSYVITFWFQIAAQRNVSFNVNAASNFTTANLLLYLDAITDAMQIYYFYTSIITYCSNINNGNAGMRTLRSFILADDMDYLIMMRDRLARMPIPPNLKILLFWMNQSFQASSMPGSSIIKTMPMPFATSGDANYEFTALNSNYVTGVFAALSSDPVNNIANLLAKIVPEWTKQPLDAPSSVSLHDPQFTTLFANLPNNGSNSAGAATKTPSTTGNDSNIVYSSYTNGLDGAMLGLLTFYETGVANWTPGLLDTSLSSGYGTTRFATRISYLSGLSGKGFYPATTDSTICASRGETYYTTTAAQACTPFGSEQVYGVNINAVSETGYELLKFLLSLDTLEASTGGRSSSTSSRSSKGSSSGNKRFSGKKNTKTKTADSSVNDVN